MPHVESLHVYPVKGCRPVDVQSAWFERTGLAFDRQWMFVKDNKGNKADRFTTQRQWPKIALIETAIPEDVLARPSHKVQKDAKLTLTVPGMEKLQVPLVASGESRQVKIWEFEGTAYDQGDVAAEWITTYLGEPHRLVRYAGNASASKIGKDKKRRQTDPDWTANQEVAFADGFPALIVTQATLAELNRRLEEQNKDPLPMNRFRGNIVVTECAKGEEDEWEKFAIGSVEVTAVKPCDRCKVTTTDQATAEVSKEREPLVTLKTFRSSEALDWGMGPVGVFFGWNLVPDTQGLIKVGDTINCLQRRTTRVTLPGKQLKPAASKPDAAVGNDNIGALKSALTGAAVAALVAALVASFFYYLMKAVAANDVGLVEHPT